MPFSLSVLPLSNHLSRLNFEIFTEFPLCQCHKKQYLPCDQSILPFYLPLTMNFPPPPISLSFIVFACSHHPYTTFPPFPLCSSQPITFLQLSWSTLLSLHCTPSRLSSYHGPPSSLFTVPHHVYLVIMVHPPLSSLYPITFI